MSEVAQSTTFPSGTGGDAAVTVWAAMAGADTGERVKLVQFADRVVQVEGTFDGATVVFEGSNDDTNYHTLMDPQGNALSFTASGLEAVLEAPFYVRPRTSGGGVSTAVTVTLVGRRAF